MSNGLPAEQGLGPRDEIVDSESDDGLCEGCHTLSKQKKRPIHDTYVYRELNQPHNTVRLLALPAESEDVPCLLEASIEDLPPYESVSYAWGNSGTTGWALEVNNNGGTATGKTIHYPSEVQKSTLHVGVAVAHLLHYLRPTTGWRLLWIDAVCINQSDNSEKSVQILMMDRIYSYARRVVIWVQECRVHRVEDAELAIEKLNNWEGHKTEILRDLQEGTFGNAAYDLGTGLRWLPWKLPSTHEFYIPKRCVTALECILRLPWFQRVWTLQELILARETVLCVGSNILQWNDLSSACHTAHSCDFAIECRRLAESQVLRTLGSGASSFCGRELTSHKTLNNILRITRARKATNPRDKIYGVMALMTRYDIVGPSLRVDYSLPVLDVYLSACMTCMEVQGEHANIAFLQDAGSVATIEKERQNWPSWIPDWAGALPSSSGIQMGCLQGEGSSVSTGRTSNATILAQHEHVIRGGKAPCLRVQGVRVLTIQGFIPRRTNHLFSDYYELLANTSSLYCYTAISAQSAYERVSVERPHPQKRVPALFQRTDVWSYIKDSVKPHGFDLKDSNSNTQPQIAKDTTSERMVRVMHGKTSLEIPETLQQRLEQSVQRPCDQNGKPMFKCFVCTAGFMGLAFPDAQPGDEVVILFGLEMPFVKRKLFRRTPNAIRRTPKDEMEAILVLQPSITSTVIDTPQKVA